MKKKTCYIAGVWDLFHIGHLRAIKLARARAGNNRLVVGVVSDEHAFGYKGVAPVIPYEQRREIIKALKLADSVVRQDVQFDANHMKSLSVGMVFLGDNWKELMPGHLKKMMETVDVEFIPTTSDVSTSLIKQKIRGSS